MKMFSQCVALETVNLPDTKTIGSGKDPVFYGCNDFTLNAPEVTKVENCALMLNGLTTVNLPKAKVIGSNAFYGNRSLKNVYLPSVTTFMEETVSDDYYVYTLPGHTFANCTSLENVTLGENITRIPDYAFKGSGLKTFTIPAGVTCGSFAFADCDNLEEVTFEDGVT